MVSGGLAGEGLQTGFSRHGLPPQRAPLDTVYALREHLNSVQRMVSGGCCEGLFPDTVCWTRNTWASCKNFARTSIGGLRAYNPCPSFPCFFEKLPGKPTKQKHVFFPYRTPKSLEAKGKTQKKKNIRSSLTEREKKTRNSNENKARKDSDVSPAGRLLRSFVLFLL